MNRRGPRVAAWAAALLLAWLSSTDVSAQRGLDSPNPNAITILITAFMSDPSPLGGSIGTILLLEQWKTMAVMQCSSPPCANVPYPEEGRFRWQQQPLVRPAHEAAATAALGYRAQMVLWGRTYRYGENVVVVAYLTLPDVRDLRTRRHERWSLALTTPKKIHQIDADIPARRFAFEPIVLKSAMVSEYSVPLALKVYRTPTGEGLLGTAKPPLLAATGQQGNALRVRHGLGEGWILVPELSDAPSETVGFVGGIMRVLRGHWDGAVELLAPVARNTRTPTELRIDSLLLMGLASYHLGKDFQSHLHAAEELNPLASRVIRYRVMGMLAELQKAEPQSRSRLAAEAAKYLDARKQMFPAGDRWLLTANEILAAVAQ